MCIEKNLVTVNNCKKNCKNDSEISSRYKVIILLQKRIGFYIDKLLFVVNFWACRGELTTSAVKYDEYCAKNIKY